jgi:hypothetical protein
VTLPPGIDIETGAMVFVERTDAFERGPCRTERDIAAHDIDDIASVLHLLFQGGPIIVDGCCARHGKASSGRIESR